MLRANPWFVNKRYSDTMICLQHYEPLISLSRYSDPMILLWHFSAEFVTRNSISLMANHYDTYQIFIFLHADKQYSFKWMFSFENLNQGLISNIANQGHAIFCILPVEFCWWMINLNVYCEILDAVGTSCLRQLCDQQGAQCCSIRKSTLLLVS